jgi:hypothetical protein
LPAASFHPEKKKDAFRLKLLYISLARVGNRGGKEDDILPLSDFQGNNPIQSWPPSHYTLQGAFLVSCSIQKPCVASLRSIEERDGINSTM